MELIAVQVYSQIRCLNVQCAWISYTLDRLTATTSIGKTQAAGQTWQAGMAVCHKLNRIWDKPLGSRGRGQIRPPGTSDSLPRLTCVAHSVMARPPAWGLLLHLGLVSKCIGRRTKKSDCNSGSNPTWLCQTHPEHREPLLSGIKVGVIGQGETLGLQVIDMLVGRVDVDQPCASYLRPRDHVTSPRTPLFRIATLILKAGSRS